MRNSFTYDYYPFGMLVPQRNFSSPEYRYGFQGQEKDDEIKGNGNSVNYKFRMHDPRVGRFFAVDPLTKSYPHYTPYSFSGNKVIQFIELEGAEEFTNLSLADKNKGYNIIFVVPECRDETIELDYQMALENNIPIMVVRDFDEFVKGIKQLNESNISANTLVTTSHGNSGRTKIGETEVLPSGYYLTDTSIPSVNPSDFPNLKEKIKAEYLVILSCSSGKTGDDGSTDGLALTTGLAKQTETTTITSIHSIKAGINFNGKENFNDGGTFTWNGWLPEFNKTKDYNLYLMITKDGDIKNVKDLTLNTDKKKPVNSIEVKKSNNKKNESKDIILDSPKGE